MLGAPPAVQAGGLGVVTIQTSGSAEAERPFLRSVAALHSFEYEEANEAFRQAQKIDSHFAMAYWGEAMTYNQTLWRNENVPAARQTLRRLGATPAARAATTATPKEKAFLEAVEILFGEGDAATRHQS